MEEVLSKMPEALSKHIESLMSYGGFDADPQSRKKFIKNWLKKKAFFDKVIEHQGFRLTNRIESGFKEGAILLTYSGSILTLSPENEAGKREIVYSSIEMRNDVTTKTEDKDARIDFPIEIHKPMTAQEGKIKKTSPILSIAIEEAQPAQAEATDKEVHTIGERISRALLQINKELFQKQASTSELENRDDLFEKWVILTWFRIGGWEKAVFYERAKMLWLDLFTESYGELAKAIKSKKTHDAAMLSLTNDLFGKFIDDYKWLESEKKNFDIGLMKALEEIPGREDYSAFVREKNAELSKAG